MVVHEIEHPPFQPFVVQQCDVDLFESTEDLMFLSRGSCVQRPTSVSSSENTCKSECFQQHLHSTVSEDESSETSSHHSLRSISSASSICSKSFGFTDDADRSLHSYDIHLPLHPTKTIGSKSTSKTKRRHAMNLLKTVSFTPQVTIRTIPDLSDFSKEEVSQLWYNNEELYEIKGEIKSLIKLAKANGISRKSPELRGLQTTHKKHRKAQWLMSVSCVLDEQRRQAAKNIPLEIGSETVAQLYSRFTGPSAASAYKLALEDAAAAAVPFPEV